MEFLRLLRLGESAKRNEQSAERETEDFGAFRASNPRSKIEDPKWSHRITLSARASTVGRIVRPICLAVFRLITNSNLVDCSTGISAGLIPLRILSIIAVARLKGSTSSAP